MRCEDDEEDCSELGHYLDEEGRCIECGDSEAAADPWPAAPGGVFVMGAPDQETEDDLRGIILGPPEDTPIALEG